MKLQRAAEASRDQAPALTGRGVGPGGGHLGGGTALEATGAPGAHQPSEWLCGGGHCGPPHVSMGETPVACGVPTSTPCSHGHIAGSGPCCAPGNGASSGPGCCLRGGPCSEWALGTGPSVAFVSCVVLASPRGRGVRPGGVGGLEVLACGRCLTRHPQPDCSGGHRGAKQVSCTTPSRGNLAGAGPPGFIKPS